MDVATLKAKIKSKQIPNYLIFIGPEWKVQQIYIQQIAKVMKLEVVRLDSYREVYSKIRSNALISSSKLFVVRDDTELLLNDKIATQSILSAVQSNLFIHILTTTDKRKKYYKDNQDRIVDFEPLSDSALKKYIKWEVNLSDDNCRRLIEICEHSYGRILLEIDKIEAYAYTRYTEYNGGIGNDYNSAFQDLLKSGTIYQPPYDAIWDLTDAILDRKVNTAFNLLEKAYAYGEATMVMLSVLYNNAKAVLQVQSYSGSNVSKGTGLTGWQIKNAKKHVGKYRDSELVRMMRIIQQTESGIKTGQIEDEMAMSYLLVQVL